MKGLELSRRFFFEHGLPLIGEYFPRYSERVAAGLLGTGSEVFGADDEVSRSEEWGPRFTVLMTNQDHLEVGLHMDQMLDRNLPIDYLGFTRAAFGVRFPCTRTVHSICDFVSHYTGGHASPPHDAFEWRHISEQDLFTLTSGTIFYDPLGDATEAIRAFAYYPEAVWLKRLIESLIRLSTLRNISRSLERGDKVAAHLYVAHTLEESLKLCHLINRTYAPYRKWLYWSFRRLPDLSTEMLPFVDRAAASSIVNEQQDAMLLIAEIVQNQLKGDGLVPPEHRGDLLSSAGAIYRGLGPAAEKCFNGYIHDAWGSCQCRSCDLG